MHIYEITLQLGPDNIEIERACAMYYVHEDGFIVFKDDDHKQVASVNERYVVHVARTAQAKAPETTLTITDWKTGGGYIESVEPPTCGPFVGR